MESCRPDVIQMTQKGEKAASLFVVPDLANNNQR